MIAFTVNQSTKALNARYGIQGFFFRLITSVAIVGVMLGLIAVPSAAIAQDVNVEFVDAAKLDFRIQIRNADKGKVAAETVVKVWLEGSDQKTAPPVLGKVAVVDGLLQFTPRFPLQRGKSYEVVVLVGGKEDAKTSVTLAVPAKKTKPTRIEQIYPSAEEIPENLLRIYVHFSAPMRKGDIYRHLQILEEDGTAVVLPFLEIEQELWSRDSTRLTLLFDPGRIKRGLKPREDLGAILESGRQYSLVISGKWKDANGNPLGDDVVKKIRAVDEDVVQPKPSKWKVAAPKSGSKDGLKVTFAGSLDWSMLFRSIKVMNADDSEIDGTISVSEHETVWTFVPDEPWASGLYSLSVNHDLEDATGNSVGRKFDVDVFEKTESPIETSRSAIPFLIK